MSGMLRTHWPLAFAAAIVFIAVNLALLPYSVAASNKPCPTSSAESFDLYQPLASRAVTMVYLIEQASDNPTARAQQINNIRWIFEEVPPPKCMEALYDTTASYLDLTTKMYVEKAKGGLWSEIKSWYWAYRASDTRVSFGALLWRLAPPDVPANDWQSA